MKILAWTTTPWTLPSNLALAVGPDLDYAVVEQDGDATSSSARPRVGAVRRASSARPRVVRHRQGRRAGRAHLRAAVPLLRRHARTRFRVLAGDFVDTDEGTGIVHIAPGFGEDDQRVGEANGIAARRARSTTRAASPPRCPTGPASTCSTPTRRSSATSRTQRRGPAPRDLRPQLPALLAHRHAAHLPGDVVLVRAGHRLHATGWSSSTRRSTGSPSTSATASSATGSRAPATGPSAATASGARRSRCGSSDDPAYPRIDVYGSARRARARLRRAADRPAPARSSTS